MEKSFQKNMHSINGNDVNIKTSLISCKFNDLSHNIYIQDYLIVYCLLCFSGNLAIANLPFNDLLQVVFSGYLIIKIISLNKSFCERRLLVFSYIFSCILIIQCIDFQFYPIVTIFGFCIRLLIAFAAVVLVKDFIYVYIRVMVGLAGISLFFYGLQEAAGLIGYDINIWFKSIGSYFSNSPARIPFFLHTYLTDGSHRNSGMFWEPGAFAGYLIIGLVFLSFIKTKICQREYRYYFLFLSFTLFTTMSTTGYIAYPFVILLHFNRIDSPIRVQFRNTLLMLSVIIPIMITSSAIAYQNLPFLQDKMISQFQKVEYRDYRWHLTRFGTVLFDWQYIKEKPFIGWGLNNATRFALTPHMDGLGGMGNGFTDFLAKFGSLGFITWFSFIFLEMKRNFSGKNFRIWISCLVILILLQGENFLNYPLFLSLAFIKYSIGDRIVKPKLTYCSSSN